MVLCLFSLKSVLTVFIKNHNVNKAHSLWIYVNNFVFISRTLSSQSLCMDLLAVNGSFAAERFGEGQMYVNSWMILPNEWLQVPSVYEERGIIISPAFDIQSCHFN